MAKKQLEEAIKMAKAMFDDNAEFDETKTKSFPLTNAEVKAHDELDTLAEKAKAIVGELKTKRNIFFAQMEKDHDTYDSDQTHIDREKGVVEFRYGKEE